ncbi:Uncharacterised protein [Vibrio cholerae]|nr:Uncharacterised protein [Vibrio cholerae]
MHQFGVIRVIDWNRDDGGALDFHRLAQSREQLIGLRDGVASSAKGFGVGFKINRAEFYPSSAMVFLHFLHLDHVVSVIDPNDVYDIAFEAHRGFELHA